MEIKTVLLVCGSYKNTSSRLRNTPSKKNTRRVRQAHTHTYADLRTALGVGVLVGDREPKFSVHGTIYILKTFIRPIGYFFLYIYTKINSFSTIFLFVTSKLHVKIGPFNGSSGSSGISRANSALCSSSVMSANSPGVISKTLDAAL